MLHYACHVGLAKFLSRLQEICNSVLGSHLLYEVETHVAFPQCPETNNTACLARRYSSHSPTPQVNIHSKRAQWQREVLFCRAMAVCLSLMSGRLGVTLFSLAIGFLLDYACSAAFISLSGVVLGKCSHTSLCILHCFVAIFLRCVVLEHCPDFIFNQHKYSMCL
jgi:hypothetical protein